MNATENADQDKSQTKCIEYVEKLLTIKNGNRFELWKYFENNADKLQSTLWDQGKWLLAIQGGVLFLPFTAKLIEPTTYFPFMGTKNLFLVILMYLFGIMLSAYSVAFQREMGKHIARNFDRAKCARDGSLSEASAPKSIPILRQTTFYLLAAFLAAPVLLTLEKLLPKP